MLNKVQLIGNLGQDPEIKYMPSGGAVCNLRLATSETWKDKNTGEKQERTEWHSVVTFGRLAEICGEYLRKGSQVYFEGKIQTRKWQDRDGNDRHTTEIVANEMKMLDSKGGGGGGGNWDDSGSGQDRGGAPSGGRKSAPPDDLDDDIPF